MNRHIQKNGTVSFFEIAGLFFKLGLTAFGGPVAHIAMMEDEVVTRRKWMSREHFLDLVGATNLIPGPNSTEMAIHCGFHRGGLPGLIVSGVCFIFPAVTLTGILAYFYAKYGVLPEAEHFIYGIRPAVLAVIISAVIKFSRKAVKSKTLLVIGAGVMAASLLGVNEVAAILSGGVIGALVLLSTNRLKGNMPAAVPIGMFPKLSGLPIWAGAVAAVPVVATVSAVFLVFVKIGCVLFGSGYVLIAYLEGEIVEKLGWITPQQLLDAVAIGQFTPGPVLSTSTFVGYLVNGLPGAIAATLGIFLPSFFFVAALNPIIPKLRQSAVASKFLDAVNVSAVGLMAAVTITLAQTVATDWKTLAIAAVAVVASFLYKVNAVWIVVGGALLGWILAF